MLKIKLKSKFERDVKRAQKRGKNLEKLRRAMKNLVEEKRLPKKMQDHPLRGNFVGCRECHIEPDWLLIYYVESDAVTFIRTGTHADLFQ